MRKYYYLTPRLSSFIELMTYEKQREEFLIHESLRRSLPEVTESHTQTLIGITALLDMTLSNLPGYNEPLFNIDFKNRVLSYDHR